MTTTFTIPIQIQPVQSDQASLFIRKLYQVLEEQKFTDIVDWNTEGTALVIKMPVKFAQTVLPTYFKHNNLTSLVRQLNMYGFNKRRTQKYDHVYHHNLFQNGKKHLLKDIKKKNQESNLACIQKALNTLKDVTTQQNPEETDQTLDLYKNQLLKKLNKDTVDKIDTLENKVKELTTQNQMLWDKVTYQNKKEDVMISFLFGIMKNKGLSPDQVLRSVQDELNLSPLDSIGSIFMRTEETVNPPQKITKTSGGTNYFVSTEDPLDTGEILKKVKPVSYSTPSYRKSPQYLEINNHQAENLNEGQYTFVDSEFTDSIKFIEMDGDSGTDYYYNFDDMN